MSGFYELKCKNPKKSTYTFYYFYSPRPIKSPKDAIKRGHAPDKIRIVIGDENETPIQIRFMHNIFEYLYKKYFQKERA
jgi:hypothetical protein